MVTGMILIDLQKFFDKIDHDILAKITCDWFLEAYCKLFRYYLSNRSFLIKLENNFLQPAFCIM